MNRGLRTLLLPFVPIFGALVAIRNMLFDNGMLTIHRAHVPVISVGNISSGGTGKTPVVEWLLDLLKKEFRVAVVSRGYRRTTTGTLVVSDGRSILASAGESGDEPYQIARRHPEAIVVVDADRAHGATCAAELQAQVILLDDGFQHRRLGRDLNMVLMTAREIINGDLMLPAGNRREPYSSLVRADMLLITKCAGRDEFVRAKELIARHATARGSFPRIAGAGLRFAGVRRLRDAASVMEADWRGAKAMAFSGIGTPESFSDLLSRAGITVVKHMIFGDHHWFKPSDVRSIAEAYRESGASMLVTTEKDAARLTDPHLLKEFADVPLFVAEAAMEFLEGEAEVQEMVASLMRRPTT